MLENIQRNINYDNNLYALKEKNFLLAQRLEELTGNVQFDIYTGATENDINLYDLNKKTALYLSPQKDTFELIERLKKYKEYEFLYLYGLGNGLYVQKLFDNTKLKRVLIIEPELEIIFAALHFSNFSDAILKGRIVLLLPEQITFSTSLLIFSASKARLHAKIFTLQPTIDYYALHYSANMLECVQTMSKALVQAVTTSGNDVNDAITGVRHHIKNLPLMIQKPKFKELLKKKNSDVAIIVSTGPSLNKQLEQLKKVAPYATLISVDASLPILEKHGISPDLCTSIERVALSAEFFKNTSKEFMKDTIFVNVSLQHQEVIDSLKEQTSVLVMRPFKYNEYFELPDYGYVGHGMSAANMAHELAILMKFKNIILIGQDLAFSKDGTSHSPGHVFGTDEVNEAERGTEYLPAYGGDGMVKTQHVWRIFLGYFDQTIASSKSFCQTINATEGGARIPGALELPFKTACEEYIDMTKKKSSIDLQNPSNEENIDNLHKLQYKIKTIIDVGYNLQSIIESTFLEIAHACKRLEGLDEESTLKTFSEQETLHLLNLIDDTRKKIDQNDTFHNFYYEPLQSFILHQELDLSKIRAMYVDNTHDNQIKALQWIVAHQAWFFTLAGGIENVRNTVLESSKEYCEIS